MRRVLGFMLMAVSATALAQTAPQQKSPSDAACRTWQWVNPRPESRYLTGVAAGDPGVVAVGDSGTILFSPEGISWRAVSSGTTAYLRDVVWTGQTFFAVGDTGTVVTSADGVSWTILATDTDLDLVQVAFGDGVLVAVGPESNLLTSSDGISWTVTTFDAWAQTDDIVWTGTQFIVVGPTMAAVSPDGLLWQAEYRFGLYGSSYREMSLTWTGSQAVASALSFGKIYSSTNGLDWSTVAVPSEGIYAWGLAWLDDMLVVLGDDIWISPDLNTWTPIAYPATPQFGAVSATWTGKRMVLVGPGTGVMTSRTGTQWSVAQIAEGPIGHFRGFAGGDGRLVAVSLHDDIAVSTDGFEWTTVPRVAYFRDLAFGNSRFVAVTGNESAVSLDGQHWNLFPTGTSWLWAVEWVGDRFLAVNQYGGGIVGSPDGESWATEFSGTESSDYYYGLGAGNGNAVAVGYDSDYDTPSVLIERSPGTWERVLPFLGTEFHNRLRDITYGAGRWVAVGTDGMIVTSTDLDTLQVIDSGVTDSLYSISWNGSEFLAAGSGGAVISSPDGLIWTQEIVPTQLNLSRTEWFDGAWYVAGNQSTILRGACAWPPDAPVAGFSFEPSDPAPGEVVRFTDASTGYATSWSWLFGGGYSSATSPSHVYTSPGFYNVMQTVCNGPACDTATGTVTIAEKPPEAALAWRFATLIAGEPATWLDLSAGLPTSWSWIFGDGAVSTAENPVHTYIEPGIYTARLEVSNLSGMDRAEAQVVVGPTELATSTDSYVRDIVWNGHQWLATKNDSVMVSTNGSEWTDYPFGGAYDGIAAAWTGAEYVVVGTNGTIGTSHDGSSWDFTEIEENFTDVISCDGLTVVVGDNGTILVSPDLETWQAGSSGTTDDLRRVACGNGLFVATVGGSPAIIESTDGLSWSPATTDGGSGADALTWGDGHFYAVETGNNNGVLTRREDGIWTKVDKGLYSPEFLEDLTVVDGLLIGSGGHKLWWLSPELSAWVPVDGWGDGRMEAGENALMVIDARNIRRLDIQPERLLADGFESGDLSAWSGSSE